MPPVYRLTTREAPSQVCLRLVTVVNCFTADTCQGWTRLWLDQLPGLYFLPDHMGTGMVTEGVHDCGWRVRGSKHICCLLSARQPLGSLEGVSRVSQRLRGGAALGKMHGGGRGFTFIRVQGGRGLEAETENRETHSLS